MNLTISFGSIRQIGKVQDFFENIVHITIDSALILNLLQESYFERQGFNAKVCANVRSLKLFSVEGNGCGETNT